VAPTIPQAVRDEVLAITLAEPPAELGTSKFGAARGLRQLRQPQTPRGAGLDREAPGITLHFTPASGSWTDLVEVYCGIITGQAIRRGTFSSVAGLETAIGIYLDGWNQRCRPFSWAKDADTILAKATPPRKRNTHTNSETRH
jgi:hypothetical protein